MPCPRCFICGTSLPGFEGDWPLCVTCEPMATLEGASQTCCNIANMTDDPHIKRKGGEQ